MEYAMNTDNIQYKFKRHEQKYIVEEQKYIILEKELKIRCKPDQFANTTICSIYFDTPDYYLIRRSLEKPVYKEKLRLRSYGQFSKEEHVFVELKKKYKGVVCKQRIDISVDEASEYLSEGKRPSEQNQVIKEIDRLYNLYGQLKPKMWISSHRTAWQGIGEDTALRITFDRDILWRENQLNLEEGIWGEPIFVHGERIMEIKSPQALPFWLARLLSELEIYPTSFSKYGTAYKQSILNKTTNREGKRC
jgi:SPX domain protein involved in polyphosphate accumulation